MRRTIPKTILLALVPLFFLTVPVAYAQAPVAGFTVNPYGTPVTGSLHAIEQEVPGSWTPVNNRTGWSPRIFHSSAVMPDGSIILTGGFDGSAMKRDVWHSTDNGTTWTRMTAAAAWPARHYHSSAALSDGSIVLMGGSGFGSTFMNDVWRSTDNGATWSRLPDAPWERRSAFTSVVLSDDSIVVLGGASDYPYNDVWRSTDKGATWTQMTASAGWIERYRFAAVALPDDSIVVMGGATDYGEKNDVWRSTDKGATWTQMTAHAGWYARQYPSAAALPDGSIVLMGGDNRNDMWRSTDYGATWTQVAAAGMPRRDFFSAAMMPDGSIILTGSGVAGHSGSSQGDVWRFTPGGSEPIQQPVGIAVTKTVRPVSLKQGTDANITITVFNGGPGSVHDVEILDSALPEFPVVNGSIQCSVPLINPNDTGILTYTVHATKSGTFRLGKTAVMYADLDGNYRVAYSGYANVEVLRPLISQAPEDAPAAGIQIFFAGIESAGRDLLSFIAS